MAVYYNELEPAAAHVLECLIKDRVIADGIVDKRSIADVDPKDVAGFRQAHFFAGGGLWSVAARMAGWSDDAPLWTGSCPCQPFSVAGKGLGQDDPRHLWPHFFRLIRAVRPPVVVGEQVAGSAGYRWFDGVAADLEGEGYASRAVDIPACAIDAPHIRQRLYWCAVEGVDDSAGARRSLTGRNTMGASRDQTRRQGFERRSSDGRSAVADPDGCGRAGRQETPEWIAQRGTAVERPRGDLADTDGAEPGCGELGFQPVDGGHRGNAPQQERASFWSDYEWRTGADGKARRVKSGVCLLAHGVPNRVSALRLAGNAIVAPLAAEVLKALMETYEIPR